MKKNSAFWFKAVPIIIGCAVLYCDKWSGGNESLHWKSAADLPVNLTFAIKNDLNMEMVQLDDGDIVVFDLGADTLSLTSDFMNFLRKLTRHEAGYQLELTNNTNTGFTLYGLLYDVSDVAVSTLSPSDFYRLLSLHTADSLANYYGHISLLGSEGMIAGPGEKVRGQMPAGLSAPLCDLMLGGSNLIWRWLAAIGSGDIGNLGNTGIVGNADVKVRINVSGVNCFDSLLTM